MWDDPDELWMQRSGPKPLFPSQNSPYSTCRFSPDPCARRANPRRSAKSVFSRDTSERAGIDLGAERLRAGVIKSAWNLLSLESADRILCRFTLRLSAPGRGACANHRHTSPTEPATFVASSTDSGVQIGSGSVRCLTSPLKRAFWQPNFDSPRDCHLG